MLLNGKNQWLSYRRFCAIAIDICESGINEVVFEMERCIRRNNFQNQRH